MALDEDILTFGGCCNCDRDNGFFLRFLPKTGMMLSFFFLTKHTHTDPTYHLKPQNVTTE